MEASGGNAGEIAEKRDKPEGGLWGVIARGASVAEKGKEPAPGANEWWRIGGPI